MNDSPHDQPIVFVQPRARLVLLPVAGVLLLALAASGLVAKYRLDGVLPFNWVLVFGGAAAVLFGVLALVRPGRLTLSPTGFEYRRAWATRQMSWSTIRSVGFWTVRGAVRGVSLQRRAGPPLRLAGGWPLGTKALAAQIEDARRRWTPRS